MKKVRYITLRNVREKLNHEKGFTLIEMLIVVAIIAILVAVSIPVVKSSLDKAKHSTDAANERAAKAEILVEYFNTDGANSGTYYYEAKSGKMVSTGTAVTAYGKHTGHTDKWVAASVNADGDVAVWWANATTSDNNLCSTASGNDLNH